MHRQAINRGRVAYEPNSLAGGCPFQAGAAGFVSFPQRSEPQDHKVRGKAERFADHYTQATLFWNSQTEVEKMHIINAFRFELSRVQTPAIRERMVSGLLNVAPELANAVAAGLGLRELPPPMPKALQATVKPEVTTSTPLSLFARPGDGSIRTRRVAVLVADGFDNGPVDALVERLAGEGAVPRFIGPRLGAIASASGAAVEVDLPLPAASSVLFDATIVAGGAAAAQALSADGRALEFVKDSYRHCKTIVVLGEGQLVLDKAGIPADLPDGSADPGLIVGAKGGKGATGLADAVVAAIARHRHFERETDPPRV
jgi:catalase